MHSDARSFQCIAQPRGIFLSSKRGMHRNQRFKQSTSAVAAFVAVALRHTISRVHLCLRIWLLGCGSGMWFGVECSGLRTCGNVRFPS